MSKNTNISIQNYHVHFGILLGTRRSLICATISLMMGITRLSLRWHVQHVATTNITTSHHLMLLDTQRLTFQQRIRLLSLCHLLLKSLWSTATASSSSLTPTQCCMRRQKLFRLLLLMLVLERHILRESGHR